MAGLLDFLNMQRGGQPGSMPSMMELEGLLGGAFMPGQQQQPGGLLGEPQPMGPPMPMPQKIDLRALPINAPPEQVGPGGLLQQPMPEQQPPMPPMRPPGLGMLAQPSAAAPAIQAPMGPPMPAQAAPMAAPVSPAAQAPQKPQPGFLERLGDVAGSIYGQGGPGDALLALGAGVLSGRNIGDGLMRGMSMVNANSLTAKKKLEEERKLQGQQMLARHLAAQSGGKIPESAALGIIQSGNAGQFLQEQFRSPTSEQEYNFYKKTESDGGRAPLTFDQWYTRNKQIESGVGETSFEQGAGKAQVERLGKIIETGAKTRESLVDFGQMREISGRVGSQGSMADVKGRLAPIAEALGIPFKDAPDIQVFNSIVSRVAPTLREPGSGSTSDIEYAGMLASLPKLSNDPAARGTVIDTMEAMARDKASRADIASKMLNREIDRKEGERMMRELPDPMTAFKAFKSQNPALFAGAPPSARPPAQQQGQPRTMRYNPSTGKIE